MHFELFTLPETDGQSTEILCCCSQSHVSCVSFLWEDEHFTGQIYEKM